jgi:DHA2 family multidrug resistance protein-like MFS transporter
MKYVRLHPEHGSRENVASRMDGLPTPRRYLAILAVAFGTALAVIDGSIVTVALPTLARDLNVEPSAAVLVVTVYQLVLVMTLLPFSALGTRIGLRRLYQYGQFVFLVSTVLCFFARSLPALLIVRVLQGLGAGAALSVSSALIRGIYPARQLGHRAHARRIDAVGRLVAVDIRRSRAPGAAVAGPRGSRVA